MYIFSKYRVYKHASLSVILLHDIIPLPLDKTYLAHIL